MYSTYSYIKQTDVAMRNNSNNRDLDIREKRNFPKDTSNFSLMTQFNICSDNTLTFVSGHEGVCRDAIIILLVSISGHLKFLS